MQFIQDTNAGGRLGEALGTGLHQLAQHKLSQLQTTAGLTPVVGRDAAKFLSLLGPEERQIILQDVNALQRLQSIPNQEQNGLAALGQQQGQQRSSQQEPEMQQLGQQFQEEDINDLMRKYFQNPTLGKNKKEQFQNISRKQPQIYEPEPSQNRETMQKSGRQLTSERAQQIADLFTSPQEKRERKKLELVERQAGIKERESLIKETKQYVDNLKDKEKASKESDLRLKRMETLIDKGNLPNAALWSALSKFENAPFISGLTAPFAELLKGGVKLYSGNPADIEEFEKLSSEFVKNAKQYFGPRVTQKEVELFMQTVPTLMQTDQGKKKLIENIRSLNELAEIEAKAARSIIKDNGGIPPRNIEQQVQDRISSKLDKVAKKFIER